VICLGQRLDPGLSSVRELPQLQVRLRVRFGIADELPHLRITSYPSPCLDEKIFHKLQGSAGNATAVDELRERLHEVEQFTELKILMLGRGVANFSLLLGKVPHRCQGGIEIRRGGLPNNRSTGNPSADQRSASRDGGSTRCCDRDPARTIHLGFAGLALAR
jgi:hypothetical protein